MTITIMKYSTDDTDTTAALCFNTSLDMFENLLYTGLILSNKRPYFHRLQGVENNVIKWYDQH